VSEIRRGASVEHSDADPFQLLRELLGDHRPSGMDAADLPFVGGAVGYFGYDLARRIERLPAVAETRAPARARFGIYAWAVMWITRSGAPLSSWNDLSPAQPRASVLAIARPRRGPCTGAVSRALGDHHESRCRAYRRAFGRIQTTSRRATATR